MHFDLPENQQQFLEHLVTEGRYPSIDQAMLDAIRLLECRESLRAEVRKGIEDAEAGNLRPADEVLASLRSKLDLMQSSPNQDEPI